MEAESAPNGIGLVRLMGRNSGFIALQASMASRDVNMCLIPEVDFELEGENGVLANIMKRVKAKGHCLVVVAEGADDAAVDLNLEKDG